jgi:hypothetical protein
MKDINKDIDTAICAACWCALLVLAITQIAGV